MESSESSPPAAPAAPPKRAHALDRAEARGHLRRLSCTDREGSPWPLYATDARTLGIYGIGIELYFLFTRRFACIFTVALVLTAPFMLVNLLGATIETVDIEHQSNALFMMFARTTIANLGRPAEGGGGEGGAVGRVVEIGSRQVDIRSMTFAIGVLDGVIALALLMASVWFELVTIPSTIARHRRSHVTPEAFTVSVRRLPKQVPEGHDAYARLLREHFEALLRASVTNHNIRPGMLVLRASELGCGAPPPGGRWPCCPCRRPKGCDARGRRLGRIVSACDDMCEVEWLATSDTASSRASVCIRNARGEATGGLVDAAYLVYLEQSDRSPELHVPGEPLVHEVSLVRNTNGAESPDILGAFVVFNRAQHRDFIYTEYRFSRLLLGRWVPSPRLRFAGRGIYVREAPAPSNLFWANLGFPECRKRLWRLMALLAWLLLFLGCVGLFSAAKNSSLAAKEYGAKLHVDRDLALIARSCQETGYRKVLADNPPGIHEQCRDWLEWRAKAAAWATAAALAVIAINCFLEVTIVHLVDLQRPKTVTSRSRKIMNMVFMVQLVNLGFITTLVHFNLGIDFLGEGILGLIGNGSMQDFTYEWYVAVGGSVLLTMCLNAVCPLLEVLRTYAARVWRCCCACRQKSQSELLELYTPPHFELAVRHAQQLSAIFVTLLFSAGMPLLIVQVCVCMCLFYWSDKYVLLRASRVPPRYTEDLMIRTAQLLQLGLWMHSAVAVWLYGHTEVVPSYSYDSIGGDMVSNVVDGVRAFGDKSTLTRVIAERIFVASALPNIVILALASTLFLVRLLYFLLGRNFGRGLDVAASACCCFRRRNAVRGRSTIFEEAFQDEPLKEMICLKVAHSYELADMAAWCKAQSTGVLGITSFGSQQGGQSNMMQSPPMNPSTEGEAGGGANGTANGGADDGTAI